MFSPSMDSRDKLKARYLLYRHMDLETTVWIQIGGSRSDTPDESDDKLPFV